MTASSNPFRIGSRGWGTLVHQNHAAEEENGSIMVGMFVSLCLTSTKPSEREFFVPAGTDLGVKLLSRITCLVIWYHFPNIFSLNRALQLKLVLIDHIICVSIMLQKQIQVPQRHPPLASRGIV